METNMENLGYYNGKYDLIENMYVPMNDRACFFGDGIYEALLAKDGKLHFEDLHLKRFYENIKILGLNFDMDVLL